MRVPIQLFEPTDLSYLRDKFGMLRRRGDCLVFNPGEWRRVCKIVEGSGVGSVKRVLLLRMCGAFWELYECKSDMGSLVSLVTGVSRLDEGIAAWMLEKLGKRRRNDGNLA